MKAPLPEPPDKIPLSALNQYTYCPRRCYLIHAEGEFTEALLNIFENDRSAARGEMVVRGLYDFEHVGTQHENNAEQNRRESRLGCAHAHKLFEGIKIELSDEAKSKGFPESFTDYQVTCEWTKENLPKGVQLHQRHTD